MSDEGRIAVGVSGAGSHLRALAAAVGRGEVGGAIVLVFADRSCPALDWAIEQGIETVLVPGGDDATLARTLSALAADVVVLAGYMRIVGPAVLAAFGGRIINTHPSLLPAFPGAHAVADALAHGVTVTGCTVHFVDNQYDHGPIIWQQPVPVFADDTADTLAARVFVAETEAYPHVLKLLAAGRVQLDGGRVTIRKPTRGAGGRASAMPID